MKDAEDCPVKPLPLAALFTTARAWTNYARICRQRGPPATDIVLSPSTKLHSLVPSHTEVLAEPS